jgi:predicted TPR repeat methyltransferase
MLAAAGGAVPPARASDGYVRDVFDDFADSFDQNLEQLKYEAPQLLHAALQRPGQLPRQSGLRILDLGCGTGLCGPLLRPWAARLVGVDLSPKMLSKAAARGVYDQLNCAELTQWLAEEPQPFDVVICADVLCYFGDLASALPRVRAVLTPGGSFTCSLEALQQPTAREPYRLLPHGRYQHDRGYVERTLAAAGFTSVSINEGTLRYERSEPVIGYIVMSG